MNNIYIWRLVMYGLLNFGLGALTAKVNNPVVWCLVWSLFVLVFFIYEGVSYNHRKKEEERRERRNQLRRNQSSTQYR